MGHEFHPDEQPATAAGNAGPQPYIPAAPKSMAKVLPHAPRGAFVLRFHPRRWGLMDGDILPILGTLKTEDLGVNGVDKTGNTDEAWMMSHKNGWRELPWDVLGPDRIYIRATDATGGRYFHTQWEIPQYDGDRVLASKTDHAGYYAFLRELLARGIIPQPDPAVLEQGLIDTQSKKVDNLRGKTNHPGVAEVFEVEKARLDDLRGAAAALRDPKLKAARAAKRKKSADAQPEAA